MNNQEISEHSVYPASHIAWATVGVLAIAYMFSFMDRTILALLIEPIKQDLEITDTQISLLTGFSFAVVYTTMGIPMGRLADIWVRKYVIIFGVTVWSLMTIASGFARSFPQLFIARMGVGFGEAGLTAPAYAMIADLFPPQRLAFAMSVFVLGGAVGAALSLLLGGMITAYVQQIGAITLPLLGEIASWRLVLVIAGGVSLLVVIPMLFVPEPNKKIKQRDTKSNEHNTEKKSPSFKSVLAYLKKYRSFYGRFTLAISINAAMVNGVALWLPTYFIRVHGWEASDIGITIGLVMVLPLLIGCLISGWLSDKCYQQGMAAAPVYFMVAVGPLLLFFTAMIIYFPVESTKFIAIAFFYLIASMHAALLPAVIQLATLRDIRSQVSAIILFFENIIGLIFGPTLVALMTDYVFRDDLAVGDSIALVTTIGFAVCACIFITTVRPYSRQLLVNKVGTIRELR